jgi:hypothetical protein
MKPRVWFALAGFVVLGLVLVLWRDRARSTPGTPAAGASPSVPPPAPLALVDLEQELARREALAFEPAPAPAAPEEAPPDPVLTIGARLIDRSARPLAGGTFAWLVPDADHLAVERRVVRADANGAVWLTIAWNELDSTQPLVLAAHAPGCVRFVQELEPTRWMAGALLSLGEIQLAPGGVVRGRVVDEAGVGLAGALVALGPELGEVTDEARAMARVWPLIGDLGLPGIRPVTRSAVGGAYELLGVPSGRFAVVALSVDGSTTFLPDRAESVSVRAGEETRVRDLVAARAEEAELVRGRVFAPDGQPCAGAWIALGHADGREIYAGRARSGPDGRFTVPALTDRAYLVLVNDGAGRYAQVNVPNVRPGDPEVVARFEGERPARSLPEAK